MYTHISVLDARFLDKIEHERTEINIPNDRYTDQQKQGEGNRTFAETQLMDTEKSNASDWNRLHCIK